MECLFLRGVLGDSQVPNTLCILDMWLESEIQCAGGNITWFLEEENMPNDS